MNQKGQAEEIDVSVREKETCKNLGKRQPHIERNSNRQWRTSTQYELI